MSKKKEVTKHKKLNKLDKYLLFSISVLILYTVVEQTLSYFTGIERSTLTTCFFAAFGGETLSCAVIKVFNIKHGSVSSEAISDVKDVVDNFSYPDITKEE